MSFQMIKIYKNLPTKFIKCVKDMEYKIKL